ncbi:MAG: hypothetical protein HKN47_03050 [Pirellulaceae bacterium]|nr:hypothetical protein [Pirellulaceae bacterium]
MSEPNPYDPPPSQGDAPPVPLAARILAPTRGPMVVVAVGIVLGAIAGFPLLVNEQSIGYFTMIPGSIVGGLMYRRFSASFPKDPATGYRRLFYGVYAIVVFAILLSVLGMPGLTTRAAKVLGRWMGATMLFAVISSTIAAGLAVSGNRRRRSVKEGTGCIDNGSEPSR